MILWIELGCDCILNPCAIGKSEKLEALNRGFSLVFSGRKNGLSDVDWLIATALFLGAALFAIMVIPSVLPKSGDIPISQYDALAKLVGVPAKEAVVLIRSPCDSEWADCSNQWNAVRLDGLGGDSNMVFSRPFAIFGKGAYSNLYANTPYSVFLLDQNAASFVPTATSLLSFSDLGVSGYAVQNNSLSSGVLDNALHARYTNPNNSTTLDVNLFFKSRTALQGEHVSLESSSLADAARGASVRMFSDAMELWAVIPKDQNLVMQSNAFQWQFNQPYSETDRFHYGGRANPADWWDSSPDDFNEWSYRFPITFNAGSQDRADFAAQWNASGDFISKELDKLGASVQNIDPHSFRLVEYDGAHCTDSSNRTQFCDSIAIDCAPAAPFPNMSCYDSSGGSLQLRWIVSGTTPKETDRTYFAYFDLQGDDDGIMPEPTDAGTINPTSSIDPAFYSTGIAETQQYNPVVSSVEQFYLSGQNTAVVSFHNAVQSSWATPLLFYRIGFGFDSGNYPRTDYNATAAIDFNQAFFDAGCSACALNISNIRLFEADDLDNGIVLAEVPGPQFQLLYDAQTSQSVFYWTVGGLTQPKTKRYYHLYFDRVKP